MRVKLLILRLVILRHFRPRMQVVKMLGIAHMVNAPSGILTRGPPTRAGAALSK